MPRSVRSSCCDMANQRVGFFKHLLEVDSVVSGCARCRFSKNNDFDAGISESTSLVMIMHIMHMIAFSHSFVHEGQQSKNVCIAVQQEKVLVAFIIRQSFGSFSSAKDIWQLLTMADSLSTAKSNAADEPLVISSVFW